MAFTSPLGQNVFIGQYVDDATANTFVQDAYWDDNGDGTGDPYASYIYWNTTDNVIKVWNGTSWEAISGLWIEDTTNSYLYPQNSANGLWFPDDIKLAFGNDRTDPDAYAQWDSSGFLDIAVDSGNYIKLTSDRLEVDSLGSVNILIGVDAGRGLNSGTAAANIALGPRALGGSGAGTSGDSNIAIGRDALTDLTSGNRNVALGYRALQSVTTGDNNFGLGSQALETITTADYNVAIGTFALQSTTSGYRNIAIGATVLQSNTTGYRNVGIGSAALYSSQTAAECTCIGDSAGSGGTGAQRLTAIGAYAGWKETGWYRVYIDNQSRADLATGRADSLMYGGTTATPQVNPTNQYLYINGRLHCTDAFDHSFGTDEDAQISWDNTAQRLDITVKSGDHIKHTSDYLQVDHYGSNNIFVGTADADDFNAGTCTGDGNCFLGNNIGRSLTDGRENLAFGTANLRDITGGDWNTAIGTNCLRSLTDGQMSVAVGSYCAYNTNASGIVAIGRFSLSHANAGNNYSIGIGYNAGYESGGCGNYNVFIGIKAVGNSTGDAIGSNNVYIGNSSGFNTQDVDNNTGVGHKTLYSNETGEANAALGAYAGYYETGSYRIYIDNRGRGGLADGRAVSLLYGETDADPQSNPTDQYLYINGRLHCTDAFDHSFGTDEDAQISWDNTAQQLQIIGQAGDDLKITGFDQTLLDDGTSGTPILAFTSDTDNGIYARAADMLGFSQGIGLLDDERVYFGDTGASYDASMYWESANDRMRLTGAKLYYSESITPTADYDMVYFGSTFTPTVNSGINQTFSAETLAQPGANGLTTDYRGATTRAYTAGTNSIQNISGSYSDVEIESACTVNAAYGQHCRVYPRATSTVTQAFGQYVLNYIGESTVTSNYGMYAYTYALANSDIISSYGIYSQLKLLVTADITTHSHVYISDGINAGTLDNQRGLFIEAMTAGTNNWAIYIADGNASSFIGGNFEFQDSVSLLFGDDNDIDISWDNAGKLDITGAGGAEYILFDNLNRVEFDVNAKMMDDYEIYFGSGSDSYARWAASDNRLELATSTANSDIWFNPQQYAVMPDGKHFVQGDDYDAHSYWSDGINTLYHYLGTIGGIYEWLVKDAGGALRSRLRFDADEFVINDGAQDMDFRLETDGNTHMLYTDAGNDDLYIGDATNRTKFDDDGVQTMEANARVKKTLFKSAGELSYYNSQTGTISKADSMWTAPCGVKARYVINSDKVTEVTFDMPYDIDTSEDISIIVHWYTADNDTGHVVDWEFGYILIGENDDCEPGAVDATLNATPTCNGTADGLTSTTLGTISVGATDKLLLADLTYDDSDSTVDENIYVLGISLEYTANKLGEAV